MIPAASLLSLCLGTAMAYAATKVPDYSTRLEQSGGTLFIAGLVMIGAFLPRFC